MDKGCILPFPKKGDLVLAKNYRGITLTSIETKIYNALLLNRKEPKREKILRKNQNGFQRNRSTTSQILTIREILGILAKNRRQQYYLSPSPKPFTQYTEEYGANHHHHHVVLVARISLTLSRHFSLSFITSGRSSGQHPASSHSC